MWCMSKPLPKIICLLDNSYVRLLSGKKSRRAWQGAHSYSPMRIWYASSMNKSQFTNQRHRFSSWRHDFIVMISKPTFTHYNSPLLFAFILLWNWKKRFCSNQTRVVCPAEDNEGFHGGGEHRSDYLQQIGMAADLTASFTAADKVEQTVPQVISVSFFENIVHICSCCWHGQQHGRL